MISSRKTRRGLQAQIREFDAGCDIQVDAKYDQHVMIFANPRGRKIVESVFPGVAWETDEILPGGGHSADWLFSHILVQKLPDHLEAERPLALAAPDAIGLAVAICVQQHAEVGRVALWHGELPDIWVAKFANRPDYDAKVSGIYRRTGFEFAPPPAGVQ
jgi:hypothetical protein